jgi:lipoprotein-anchoring transpeptidase ErfK/SrfK
MGPRPVRLPRSVYIRRRVMVGIVAAVVVASPLIGVAALRSGGTATATTGTQDAAATTTVLAAAAPPSTTVAVGSGGAGAVVGAATATSVPAAGAASDVAGTSSDASDLDGGEFTIGAGCTLTVKRLGFGDSGEDVACLQTALAAKGVYDGSIDGVYGEAVRQAVVQLQTDEKLFVDGVVGGETAGLLGIRKPLELRVVRTPPPPAGAMDRMGFPLSPVASTGDKAPPVPENSGSGKRVVYDRLAQRVWAVDEDGHVVRSWLVSGSKYENEVPGTHRVYSRSEQSTAWNGKARLPLMIRYYQTDIGHIGFHGIPVEIATGKVYQTTEELGTPLSGGCQRQHNLDAQFLWAFAQVGTKVVVI